MAQMEMSRLERKIGTVNIDRLLFAGCIFMAGLIIANARNIPEYAENTEKMIKSCETYCIQKYDRHLISVIKLQSLLFRVFIKSRNKNSN